MKKIVFLLAMLSVAMTSCLKDEAYVAPPTVTVLPLSIIPGNDVILAANITADAEGATIQSVMITYTANGVSTTGEMTLDVAPKYVYTIPAEVNTDGAVVKYIIEVKASNGKIRYKEGNYMVTNIDYTSLVVNEVDGTQKFVEIFNNGANAIPLAGVAIWKNGAVYATISGGNSIPTKGFATIGADGVQTFPNNVTVNETTGGMSAKQTLLIELKTPSGTVLSTFQRGVAPWGITISAATGSYARIPDGTGAFKVAVPSPGAANPTSGGEDIPQS